jgi:hypothetical protein
MYMQPPSLAYGSPAKPLEYSILIGQKYLLTAYSMLAAPCNSSDSDRDLTSTAYFKTLLAWRNTAWIMLGETGTSPR